MGLPGFGLRHAILALQYVQKHQNNYQYKRRVPHSVKADPFWKGKTWIVQNYRKSLGDKLIISRIAAKTAGDTAKVNEIKGMALTEEERKDMFYAAMIYSEDTPEEIEEVIRRFYPVNAKPEGLNREDRAFVAIYI
jgi:hypothetical protein